MMYRELLRKGVQVLEKAEITDAQTDAWLLLEFVTGIDRTHYFLRQSEECPADEAENYKRLLEKRSSHVPLQHLTGVQEFMGFPFSVNEHVLIPRQDTELLVLEALARVKENDSILDMCTGSGCIIISLAKKSCAQSFTGADISEEALKVAQKNASDLEADVRFVRSNLFEKTDGYFDMIVSNPPYIRRKEILNLMPEVRDFEPVLALDGSEDGMWFYREIIRQAEEHLQKNGWLLFEIGFDQGREVSALMEAAGYKEVEIKKDLAGLDRVVCGRRSA